MTIKAGDDMEFRAYRETGESAQEQIARTGASKLYRTVGRQQTMVAHLSVPADCCDPRAELYEQVDKLTKNMDTKAAPRLKGRSLMKDGEVTVVTNNREHRLQVTMTIDVSRHPDYTSRLLTLMQRVNQCFVTNQTTFLPRSR